MTLVIATGGIDLSVGSLMAIAGALAPMIFLGKLVPLASLRLAVALAFVAAGAGRGRVRLVQRLADHPLSIQPIVATLVLFIAGRGIAQVLTNGNCRCSRTSAFQFIALGRVLGIPVQVIIMAVRGRALAAFLIRRTVFGRQILAVGGNEKAARLAGMPVARVKRLVYVISGAAGGHRRPDRRRPQLGERRQPGRPRHGARRDRRGGGRRHAADRRPGQHRRHAARRLIIQLVRYTLLANGVPDAAALVVKAGLIVVAVFIQQRAEQGDGDGSQSPPRLAFLGPLAPRSDVDLARLGVIAALVALILFGALRYDNFLSPTTC